MRPARSEGDVRQLTVRLPGRLLARAQAIARVRRESVSHLVRGALEKLDREAREAELEQAYRTLGEDADSYVERAFDGQAEVARRG